MKNRIREKLGQYVRCIWIDHCMANGDTKPSHIKPWQAMPEHEREADRVIGETFYELFTALLGDDVSDGFDEDLEDMLDTEIGEDDKPVKSYDGKSPMRDMSNLLRNYEGLSNDD